MRHKKYQKVSELVGQVNVKYDEDLMKYEVMVNGQGLWSYARFYPVFAGREPVSVNALGKRTREGYREGLAAVR